MRKFSFVVLCLLLLGCQAEDPTNGFSGEYYHGNGLSVNCTLQIAEQGRFSFEWHGCLGLYEENTGTAEFSDGLLHLNPEQPNTQEGLEGVPTEFIPIQWNARLYLIAENEMLDFCNDINMKHEPRKHAYGSHYLREGDWDKPTEGFPKVAEKWRAFLLANPVRGQVLELIDSETVKINLGTEDGVRPGMLLTAQLAGKVAPSKLVVETLYAGNCIARIKHPGLNPVFVGQPVSSLRFDKTLISTKAPE